MISRLGCLCLPSAKTVWHVANTLFSTVLVFEWVCLMKSWIVVIWGKTIEVWKTSLEVVRWCSTIFWAPTHHVRRGIHRQNEDSITCLDVFEKGNSRFFQNSRCQFTLNLSPRKSDWGSRTKVWGKYMYVSWRIFLPKIASCSQKKVFEKNRLQAWTVSFMPANSGTRAGPLRF